MAQVNVLDDEFQYRIVDHDDDPIKLAQRQGCAALPLDASMCRYTVETGEPYVVEDATVDAAHAALPGIQAGIARSYLGIPLRSRESEIIGSLCVMDRVDRRITIEQVRALQDFAAVVEDQLDLVRRARELSSLSAGSAANLARAIDVGEIVPWYQPVVELYTGRVRSREALARWVHSSGRVEDPVRFVPGAEDSHLVVELDLAILRQAVTDLARWTSHGCDKGMNVNLSPLHLEIDGGVEHIRDIVARAGIDPSRLTLELTESRRLQDISRAARAVGDLRAYGFPVVLDDFGTGWSSFDWIMTLPVTGLKVDRSVSEALDSRVGQAVARAATGLARDLDLSLILEGISTASQVELARKSGYRYGQGYFWSPPVPAATVEAQGNTG